MNYIISPINGMIDDNYIAINEWPAVFAYGKNSFLLRIYRDYFVPNTELQFSAVDQDGNNVDIHIPETVEGGYKRIIVLIDDSHVNGNMSLYINGYVYNSTNEQEPITITISGRIQGSQKNLSAIRFTNTPTINVQPVYKPYYSSQYVDNVSMSVYSGYFDGWYNNSQYYITPNKTHIATSFNFGQQHIGGQLHIPSLNYNATIKSVTNADIALVSPPYKVDAENKIQSIKNMYGRLKYENSRSTKIAGYKSTAKITIYGLNSYSGCPYFVKTYYKPIAAGSVSYKLISQNKIEGHELLQDDSDAIVVNTGTFPNTAFYNQWWSQQFYEIVTGSWQTKCGSNVLLNALSVVNSAPVLSIPEYYSIISRQLFSVNPATTYQISLAASAAPTIKEVVNNGIYSKEPRIRMLISVTGSAIGVGSLRIGEILEHDNYRNNDISYTFTPYTTGSVQVQVTVDAGAWEITNISFQPVIPIGQAPTEFTYTVPVENITDDYYDIAVEITDANGSLSNEELIASRIFFSGSKAVAEEYLTINPTPAYNSYSGVRFRATSSGILSRGMVACCTASIGHVAAWKCASAKDTTAMPGSAIALEDMADGETGWLMATGTYTYANRYWRPGQLLYVCTSSRGEITSVIPTGAQQVVQIIGYATSTSSLCLNPQLNTTVIP